MIKSIKEFKENKTNWTPVIPRDLFNSSKILKCVGKLLLLNHNNQINLEYEFDNTPFNIDFDYIWNGLYITNIIFNNLHFYVPYNSKEEWPLYCVYNDEEYSVFSNTGEITNEFKKLISSF